MLICLVQHRKLYVQQVADMQGLAEDVASKNLRMLESGGFLQSETVSKYLYYRLTNADMLLDAVLYELRHQKTDTVEHVIRILTALTHERRILLVSILKNDGPMERDLLFLKEQVSEMAGRRHMSKLARRGWVSADRNACRLLKLKSRLGCNLLDTVEIITLAQV